MFAFKGDRNFRLSNTITLMKDGDQFFPVLLRRIRNARHEIFLETFILAEDRFGSLLKRALIDAVNRGVWVSITVDSYGTFFLKDEYIQELSAAGVIFQIYDPQPRWFNSRPKVFRRLHRKLTVIDNTYAYVGGINFSDEHITRNNKSGKRDFTAEVIGPVVKDIRRLCASYVREVAPSKKPHQENIPISPPPAHLTQHTDAEIALISRDNRRNRSEIEKGYLAAIKNAKHQVLIANAYFFPGYRVMRALRKAAARGVKVELILQGTPDVPLALRAAQCLYSTLIRNKISVYEYLERPLHAKIAAIDDQWSSIGSSNLDPWSLSLNLEANIFVKHPGFNQQIKESIQDLINNSRKIENDVLENWGWITRLRNVFFYHVVRRLPNFASFIPNPRPKVMQMRRIIKTESGRSKNFASRWAFPESRYARQVKVEQRYHKLGKV